GANDEEEMMRLMTLVPAEAVTPVGGVLRDGVQRASALEVRAVDRRDLDEEAGRDRRGDGRLHGDDRPEVAAADECVGADEWHGPEREVHLAGEGDRRRRRDGEREPPPLERPEGEREQDRDRPEEMAGALGHAVRRDCEGEPARERRSARKAELPQPEAGEPAGGEVGEQDEGIPGADVSQSGVERPKGHAERPPGEVDRRTRLRLKAVRVAPRRAAVPDLVAREQEVVERLEVVARRRLAVGGSGAGQEARPGVPDGRPGGGDTRREVERAGERYEACAA